MLWSYTLAHLRRGGRAPRMHHTLQACTIQFCLACQLNMCIRVWYPLPISKTRRRCPPSPTARIPTLALRMSAICQCYAKFEVCDHLYCCSDSSSRGSEKPSRLSISASPVPSIVGSGGRCTSPSNATCYRSSGLCISCKITTTCCSIKITLINSHLSSHALASEALPTGVPYA